MAFTGSTGYTWVDGEVVTATKLNQGGASITADGQKYGFAAGLVGAPSWYINGDPTTGMYSPGGSTLGLVTGGTEWVRLDNAGQLGVGGIPSNRLHVWGGTTNSIPAGGQAIMLDASTGTANTGMFVRFARGAAAKWDIGTGISTGSDIFEIFDRGSGTTALQIVPTTKAITLSGLTTSLGGIVSASAVGLLGVTTDLSGRTYTDAALQYNGSDFTTFSATPAFATGLSVLASSGFTYMFDINLVIGVNAAAGAINIILSSGTGLTTSTISASYISSMGSLQPVSGTITTFGTGFIVGSGGTSVVGIARISGVIVVANPGDFQVFAASPGGAGVATVYKGSWVRLQRV